MQGYTEIGIGKKWIGTSLSKSRVPVTSSLTLPYFPEKCFPFSYSIFVFKRSIHISSLIMYTLTTDKM